MRLPRFLVLHKLASAESERTFVVTVEAEIVGSDCHREKLA